MPAEDFPSATPIQFDELVKGWAAEKRPAEKTIYEWKRVVQQLIAFLGHDDAGRLTAKDLAAWKGALVEFGLRAKTIRDAKLTPIRAILQWAADNHWLPGNPAERMVIDVKAKVAEAKRSFNDDEAAIILKAAREEPGPSMGSMAMCLFRGQTFRNLSAPHRERSPDRWHLVHEVSRRRIAENAEFRACCSAPSGTHRRGISEVRYCTPVRTTLCGFTPTCLASGEGMAQEFSAAGCGRLA